jgi:hypothetical protein
MIGWRRAPERKRRYDPPLRNAPDPKATVGNWQQLEKIYTDFNRSYSTCGSSPVWVDILLDSIMIWEGKIPCPPKGKLKAQKGLVRLSIEIVAFTLNYYQIEGLQIWGQKGPVYLPAFIIYSFTKLFSPLYFTGPFCPWFFPSLSFTTILLLYWYTHQPFLQPPTALYFF